MQNKNILIRFFFYCLKHMRNIDTSFLDWLTKDREILHRQATSFLIQLMKDTKKD